MKNDKKTFDVIKVVKTLIKSEQSTDKKIRPNHQPSWMYRNE